MDALAAGHDAAVQMIDISAVRVHQHGACIAESASVSRAELDRTVLQQDQAMSACRDPIR
jgi:hypothetical protein